MQKYKVKITETLTKVIEIDADSEYEALQIADNNYRKADDEYILTSDNFDTCSMEIVKND